MNLRKNLSKIKIFIICFLSFYNESFGYSIKSYGDMYQNKIIIFVFCSKGYSGKESFLKDIDILIQRLNKTVPFNEIKDKIGFYYIELSSKEERLIFSHNNYGIPPYKVQKKLFKYISSRLNSNYKLIILDAKGYISCAELSKPEDTSLIILGRNRYKDDDTFAKGFLHELGHSLGLRDESLNSKEDSFPGPPNCATTKEEAQQWWGELIEKNPRVGYINGCCGNKNYFRPTIASLMNDPDKAEDFGPVNERYLRECFNKN